MPDPKPSPQPPPWWSGWKTYATAIVGFIIAGLDGSGVVIPTWVYAMLGSFGMVFIRHGIQLDTAQTTVDTKANMKAALK